MDIIKINDLIMRYKSYQRGSGFLESLKSVVVRKPVYSDALKGISFNVAEGELLGLLGPNGAGKSTTIKILTGVLYPTAGEVSVMDYVPWKQRKAYVKNIGVVFGQKSQLIWDIPPVDSFEMNRAIYGVGKNDYNKRLGELTELLELDDLIYKPTRQLSLGERMKCEFIMAMLHDPKMVFLDEPTIGLDMVAKDRIREFIKEKNAQGTTFILTTHDINDVDRLVKRVVIINFGEVVYDDKMTALRNYYGAKRLVSVTTEKAVEYGGVSGVRVIETVSPLSAELELDTDVLPLGAFIGEVGKAGVIRDMAIKSSDIESVIKMFYKNGHN